MDRIVDLFGGDGFTTPAGENPEFEATTQS